MLSYLLSVKYSQQAELNVPFGTNDSRFERGSQTSEKLYAQVQLDT